MDACVCVWRCVKVTHFSLNQHIIIKSWVYPWLILHSCPFTARFSHCVGFCCQFAHAESRAFFGLFMHVRLCVRVRVQVPMSSHYGESGWPSPGLTSVSESGGAPHRALSQGASRDCFLLNNKPHRRTSLRRKVHFSSPNQLLNANLYCSQHFNVHSKRRLSFCCVLHWFQAAGFKVRLQTSSLILQKAFHPQ